MKKFYLNRDFFTTFLHCYYPVWDNIYLFLKSCKKLSKGHSTSLLFDAQFGVFAQTPERSEFIPVFNCKVSVCNRQVRLHSLDYIIDSDFLISDIKYFPLSPAWLLPCTNYEKWLNRCAISLSVYRKADFI